MGDENLLKLVEVGATSGEKWDEKGRTEIVQIIVTYDETKVYSLRFLYYEGYLVLSNLFGEVDGSSCFDVVKFRYPSEYITGVSGLFRNHYLLSIKITTNSGTYGPFGDAARTEYNSEYKFGLGEGRAFGGFYGSASSGCGISIGMYVKLPTTLDIDEQIDQSDEVF